MNKTLGLIPALLLGGLSPAAAQETPPHNHKLRAGIELGTINAQIKLDYNIRQRHQFTAKAGYGYSVLNYGFFANPGDFADQYTGRSYPFLFWTNAKLWSSLMVNLSYRFYFTQEEGQSFPSGGYAGFKARYRHTQISGYGDDPSLMQPLSTYSLEVGVQDYIYKDRLYFDIPLGLGMHLNHNYSHAVFSPMFSLRLGWMLTGT